MWTIPRVYSAQTIANWLLSKDEMSPKKLQKMLYYCYSWVLTLQNDPEELIEGEEYNKLFHESFEAWAHGPVIPAIYNYYKPYGFNSIPEVQGHEEIDTEILEILEQVFDEYGHYTGNELESITHQEAPWLNARKGCKPFEASNNIISDEDIFNYYIQQVM